MENNIIKSFRLNNNKDGLIGRIWISVYDKIYNLDLFKNDNKYDLIYGTYIPNDLKEFVDNYGYDNLVKDVVNYVLKSL